jgi:hypothetical protein
MTGNSSANMDGSFRRRGKAKVSVIGDDTEEFSLCVTKGAGDLRKGLFRDKAHRFLDFQQ